MVKELILKSRQVKPEAEPEAICSALAALGISVPAYAVRYLLYCDENSKLSDLIREESRCEPTPTPKAIQSALEARGHKVSVRYVRLVLWRDRKPKKARKERPKVVQKDGKTSERIRELLDKNPDMTTQALVEELERLRSNQTEQERKDEPLSISANLIKVVRHKWKKRREAQERMKADEEEQRRLGIDNPPVAGVKRKKSAAQAAAETDEMLRELGWDD